MKLPNVDHKITVLRGGLDQVTPSLSLGDGYVTYTLNFECATTGGYTRVKGYERYDGHPSPSAATYVVIQVTSFANTPTVNQTLVGATSGAFAAIAIIGANYMILTKVTGTFLNTEVVKVGVTTIGIATPLTVNFTSQQNAQNKNAAADIYRLDIGTVGGASGSGSVLGVFIYNDIRYAFRNNAGGTAANLWKSSAAGWVQVTFPNEISFTTAVGTGIGGAIPPAEGATLTQGGATATVRRVMLATGAWRTGATTADAGRFILTNQAGGNFVAGAATLTGGATVVLTGAQTAVTLLPNGKFDITIGNFFGQLGTLRVYGADGVNRCFEFDGTYLCPINTGFSPDTPKHIVVHKNYLIISIASSLGYSEVGQPYRFATGGEIATGDTVSGLLPQPGSQQTGALGVFCRSTVFVLYGTSSAVFNLVPYNPGAGAIDYTMQNAGTTYYFNSEGVTNLQTTLDYGNFQAASLTPRVLPFIIQERTKVNCSVLMRTKNQYRIFFNDGYALFVTLVNGKPQGSMPMFFPHIANVAWDSELNNGDYVSYIGGTDGYVYQLECGTSFDGQNIDAVMVMNWDAMKSPRMLKAYKHATLEVSGLSYASIQFSYQLGYGTSELDNSNGAMYPINAQGYYNWDEFTWDEFTWDGQSLLPTEADMTGTAENVSVMLSSTTDYIDSYTINSIIYSYIMRRALR